MNADLFSDTWATAWCSALNASPAYQAAAADWAGTVALVIRGDDGTARRAVLVDAAGGFCRRAHAATPGELDLADYVFEAMEPVWNDLLGGRLAPAMALLSGKLRLTRGSLAVLMPHVAAARELIAAAASVTTREG